MKKLKKLNLLRPEIEVELSRPILGRLWLLVHLPKLIKRVRVECVFFNKMKYKTVPVQYINYLVIPKIKVVDCVE